MNVGLSFNAAAFARPMTAPTQAQVNAQVAVGGGSDFARDRVAKRSQNETKRANLLGMKATKQVTLKAAQVGAKKGA
ncbi:MAG: hypothetical protein AAB426_14775 [Myxococcota bacterium]